MLAKKCDRCGKLYEFYEKFDNEKQNGFSMIYVNKFGGRGMTIGDKDLCKECMESLVNWFNEKGDKKNDR